MNHLFSFFRKYATLQNAFIAIAALELVMPILHQLDLPLIALAPGQPKLDYQANYDVSAVQRLFEAYGPQGRGIYGWDLLVDTLFPLFLSLSAILFALLVVRNARWQTLLILLPLIFMTADVLENIFFLTFIGTYPALAPPLVSAANIFTRIKSYTIPLVFLQMYVCVILTIIVFLVGKLKTALPVMAHK